MQKVQLRIICHHCWLYIRLILKVIGKSKTISEGDIQLVKKLYKCEQRDRKKDQTEAKLDHWSESGAVPQVSKLAATKPLLPQIRRSTSPTTQKTSGYKRQIKPPEMWQNKDGQSWLFNQFNPGSGPYRSYNVPCIWFTYFGRCIPAFNRSYRSLRNHGKREKFQHEAVPP